MSIINIDLSDTIAGWKNKNNTLAAQVGDLALLTTSVDSDIVGAINSLAAAIAALDSDIGTLANLITTDKSDLVSAINEIKTQAINVYNASGTLLNT